jgi:UDP-N-acetylmuramoyl-tripeptide--D-alanyl-D-alanine ligase
MIAIQTLYQYFLNSTGISTDTRKIKEGSLFFSLSGANFNGNQFASEALSKGAQLAIVDDIAFAGSHHTLYFPNALSALQELAAYHRKQLDIPVIGIGGSNGKTTTKELVATTLSKKYKTYATEGNFNNHIGVPLTVLKITKEHKMAVIELGATEEGEIALLCEIAQPTHGIITNIGKDHIEGFGSIEGVARANNELYLYLNKTKGITFLNTDE